MHQNHKEQNLTNELGKLYELRDDNYFISRQDLEPFLKLALRSEAELYIFFYTNLEGVEDNIVSSLSLVYKDQKFHYPNNIEDLYSISGSLISKSHKNDLEEPFEKSHNITKKKRYRPQNSKYSINKEKISKYTSIIDLNVAIITNYEVDVTILSKILEAARIFRHASPNLMNSSLILSLKDAEQFAIKYDKSISKTALNFKNIIKKIYKIDCLLIEKNFKTGMYESIDNREEFQINLFEEILKYGRPVFHKIANINYLLFPFCNDRQTYSINYYLVLKSASPIKKFILTNLNKSANYYFNSYLSNIRLQHITDLQEKIIHIHSERDSLVRGINFEERLKEFCVSAFGPLISTTGVFSATLRLYNPFAQALHLIHEEPSRNIQNRDREITVKNRNKSINFLTFEKCGKKSFFYCKDIPLFKRNRGKLEIDRDTTKTELCFPLYFKDVKIGTVNFESPLAQAFGKQLNLYNKQYIFNLSAKIQEDDLFNYFLTIRNLIQEFGELLFESNDKLWLVERVQNYQNIHELKSLIISPQIPKDAKDTIRKAIGISPYILSGNKEIGVKKTIEDYCQMYFENMIEYNSVTLKIMKSKIKIDIHDEIFIDLESKTYILVLLENILKNFHSYHDIYNNFEGVSVYIKHDCLVIMQYFTFYNFNKLLANQYLVKPYRTNESDDGGERREVTHLGLFLIGMLVRQLRGTCYIDLPKQENSAKNSVLLIKIPI